jgi:DNA-directed RNA polymerase specialized sigma24 family protein
VTVETRSAAQPLPHLPVQQDPSGDHVGHRRVDRLVDAVAQGDRAAFGVLYRALSPRLLPGLYTRLGDPGLARRVLTGTFIEVWRLARHRVPARAADAWIAAIAEHRATEQLRLIGAGPAPAWQAAIDDARDGQKHAELAALLASPVPAGDDAVPAPAPDGHRCPQGD